MIRKTPKKKKTARTLRKKKRGAMLRRKVMMGKRIIDAKLRTRGHIHLLGQVGST